MLHSDWLINNHIGNDVIDWNDDIIPSNYLSLLECLSIRSIKYNPFLIKCNCYQLGNNKNLNIDFRPSMPGRITSSVCNVRYVFDPIVSHRHV